MNKGELIEKLSAQLGDQKTSSKAVDALVSEIEKAVTAGDKVNITGFGVFEKRERAARTGRNPRTGEPLQVKKSTVPAFRPGASFKAIVSGNGGRSNGGSSNRPNTQSARSQQAAPRAQSQAKSAHAARGQSQTAQSQTKAAHSAPKGQSKTVTRTVQGSAPRSQAKSQQPQAQSGRRQSSYAKAGQRQSSSYAQSGRRQSSSYAQSGRRQSSSYSQPMAGGRRGSGMARATRSTAK